MSKTYSIQITSSDAARGLADAKGFKLVVAKGVAADASPTSVDFNTAWITKKPSDIGNVTITWTEEYFANYTTTETVANIKITETGNDVKMDGGYYNVSDRGTLVADLVADQRHQNDPVPAAGYTFLNSSTVYQQQYIPILKTGHDGGVPVAFWAASTGVPKNGSINAVPVQKVRVWLGKYEAGDSVRATYSTQPLEFDLTTNNNGTATINDDLSGWAVRSDNAKPIFNLAAETDAIENPLFARALQPEILQMDITVIKVTATFAIAISAVVSGTYLVKQLINKFNGVIKPKKITVDTSFDLLGQSTLHVTCEFQEDVKALRATSLAAVGTSGYEEAVNAALQIARSDASSGFPSTGAPCWNISDTAVTVSYGGAPSY